MKNLIAFDIETAKDIPGDDFNWQPHRPLGISCISSFHSNEDEPRVWFSQNEEGQPDKQMKQDDVAEFIKYLLDLQSQDFTILTWNGLSFDFDILAEESGLQSDCEQLARQHVDMMFHIVCEKGFPVGLAAAAEGQKIAGKLSGVKGIEVPKLWASGEHQKVIDYVKQDARITLQVASKAASARSFRWKTRKGTISSMPLQKGWLPVDQAMRLPRPDTSWMSNPTSRECYFDWFTQS